MNFFLTPTLIASLSICNVFAGGFLENTVKNIAFNITDAKLSPELAVAAKKPLLLPLIDASKKTSFDYAWQRVFHRNKRQCTPFLESLAAKALSFYIEATAEDQLKKSSLPQDTIDIAWEKLELASLKGILRELKSSQLSPFINESFVNNFEQECVPVFKKTAVDHAITYCANFTGVIASHYILIPLIKKLFAYSQTNKYVRYALYAYIIHEMACLAYIINKTTKNPENGTYHFPHVGKSKSLSIAAYLKLLNSVSNLYTKVQQKQRASQAQQIQASFDQ